MGVVSLDDILVTPLKRIPTVGGDVMHGLKKSDNGFNGFGEVYFSWVEQGAIKAVPREEEEPYCLDMATSMISWNKLLLHKSNNKSLTEALAADKDGQPTKDPQEAVSLLPAGAYKGYGLASMVEILCSVFIGMKFGRDIPAMYKAPMDKPRHLGQFYLVMRSDGCIEKSEFSNMMQQMTDEVRLEPAQVNQKVMLAGDPQKYETLIRKREGIPLDPSTLKDFQKLSQQYSVPLQLV